MKIKTLTLIAALALCATASAQQQASDSTAVIQPNPVKAVPKHAGGLSFELGYANMFYHPATLGDGFKMHNPGGIGGGMTAFYQLQYKAFLFRTGLGFDLLTSKSRLDIPAAGLAVAEQQQTNMQYRYATDKYTVTEPWGTFFVPLMFGGEFGRDNLFFALGGFKLGLGFPVGKSKTKAEGSVYATDDDVIGNMTNMPTHGLEGFSLEAKDKIKYNPFNAAVSAEFGLNLDQWMRPKPEVRKAGQRSKRKTFKDFLHYRLSVFADYGLTDAYKEPSDIAGHFYTPAAGQAEPRLNADAAVNNALRINGDGYENSSKSRMHNFLVGVKFAIYYQYEKPQPKPKPKPQPKPKPKPPVKVVPNLSGIVFDIDTNEPIPANVQVQDQAGTKVLFEGDVDEAGEFTTKLNPGTYKVVSSLLGYQPYEKDMTFESDQLQIGMKKIPEVRIVLENLFFATNETTILPESEPALNTLYEYLTKYPERTILIIGHTDNIGTIRANQILSEGRANSVRQSMIDRGIAPERMQTEGHGELEPKVPNDSDEHRQINRRVEFMVISDGAIDKQESTAPVKK